MLPLSKEGAFFQILKLKDFTPNSQNYNCQAEVVAEDLVATELDRHFRPR